MHEEAQEPSYRCQGGTFTMLRHEWLHRRSRAVGIADDPHAKDGLAARHQLPCASGRPLGRVTLYRHSKGKKSGKRERFTIKES